MRLIRGTEFQPFIAAKPAAAVLFDAHWDFQHRAVTRQKMLAAEQALEDQANFAEVDVDIEPQLARSIHLANVPLVAYYRDGKLVAALIGAGQDVRARIERVLRGEPIGYGDGIHAGPFPCTPVSQLEWYELS